MYFFFFFNYILYINDLSTKTLSITLNTKDWYSNKSWAERYGNIVIVDIFIQGNPYQKPVILSGLPSPNKEVYQYNGSISPSLIIISKDGIMKIDSAGCNENQLISCNFVYFTNDSSSL